MILDNPAQQSFLVGCLQQMQAPYDLWEVAAETKRAVLNAIVPDVPAPDDQMFAQLKLAAQIAPEEAAPTPADG